MKWQLISTAPTDGRQILVGFKGQFRWFSFVADAHGTNTHANAYAVPTHWTEIIEPET